MNYQTYKPHKDLESIVKFYWTLEVPFNPNNQKQKIVPLPLTKTVLDCLQSHGSSGAKSPKVENHIASGLTILLMFFYSGQLLVSMAF